MHTQNVLRYLVHIWLVFANAVAVGGGFGLALAAQTLKKCEVLSKHHILRLQFKVTDLKLDTKQS